jgi:hypothetical protein
MRVFHHVDAPEPGGVRSPEEIWATTKWERLKVVMPGLGEQP